MTDQALLLGLAARALSRAGLVHAYGHASTRLDEDSFLVTPSLPLGMIAVGEPGIRVSNTGPLPAGVAGEVLAHQEIYKARPDVNAVCRVQPPKLISLSTMGRLPAPRHGFGAYLRIAYWPDPQLIRTSEKANALAVELGDRDGIVMRGNGAVVVAPSIERAVVLAWYLEDAARVELDVLQTEAGVGLVLSEEEARGRATWTGGIAERMWAYLTSGEQAVLHPRDSRSA